MGRLAITIGLLCALCGFAPAAMTTQISQFGITWTFSQSVTYGQFANGDYWVVGPVSITSISPSSSGGRNGSMVNPSPTGGNNQGFDSRMQYITYQSSLNVAEGVSSSNPLTLQAHSSLVSTISLAEPEFVTVIQAAAILTVLPSAPAAGSFRPPYSGTSKAIQYNVSDLDYSMLRSLAPVASTPDLSTVERMVERPWIDFVSGWTSRMIHPRDNMPDYGRDLAEEASICALMLHLNFTNTQKETLLIRFIQLGLDINGIIANGGSYPPEGGHCHGRKWPALFAALMFDNSTMLNNIANTMWQEDAQTYTGTVWWASGNQAAHGPRHENYPSQDYEHIHPSSWSANNYRDESYRNCCTHTSSVGTATAARLTPGGESNWNHAPFFNYTVRWMEQDWGPHEAVIRQYFPGYNSQQGGTQSAFSGNMYRAYYNFTGVTADAGPDQAIVLPDVAQLDGTVSSGGSVTTTWSKVSGPGAVTFADAGAVDTTATFSTDGTYVLRLSADDGSNSDTDDVTITVHPSTYNFPPVADAGPDQTVLDGDDNGSQPVTLDGSGSYDQDGTITYVWKENSTQIATGVSPTVTFDVGAHTIELTVTDDDSATDNDTVIITVNSAGSVTSSTEWQNFSMTAQTGACTIEYDAVPNGTGLDALTGLSYGAASAYADVAVIVRFNVSGYIDARDGGAYGSDVSTAYTASTNYHFRLVVDIPNKTYDVYVTPQGSSEVQLANDYDFRTDQSTVSTLNNWVIYSGVGTHTVDNFTVTSGGNAAPVADAGPDQTVTDTDDGGDESVTLDGTGSSDSDGSITSYVWKENSTQIATGSGPSVTLDVGVHTIELTVTDDDSATDTDTVVITVNAPTPNQPPVADAGPDQTVNDSDGGGDESVTLDGSGSSDSDGTISSYVWKEESTQIATGSGPSVTLDVGTHTIELTVTDDDSATDTDTVMITVSSSTSATSSTTWQSFSMTSQTGLCTVGFDAVPNGSGLDALTGLCYGTASEYADLAVIVRFNISDTIDARNGAGYAAEVSLPYTPGVEYHFRLEVDIPNDTYSVYVTPEGQSEVTLATNYDFRSDQTGVGTLDKWSVFSGIGTHTVDNFSIVSSGNDPPVADAGPDQSVTDSNEDGSENVTLDGSGSSDSDGTISSYVWTEAGSQIATGSGPTVGFDVGSHTVVLTVTDDDDDTDTDTVIITVSAPPNTSPTADAGTDQNVTDSDDSGDESITLDGSDSSDSDGFITSYVWKESSTQIAAGVSPAVTLTVGVHTIDLTVTDDDAATDTDSVQITINAYTNVAPTADAGPDQTVTDNDDGGDEDVTLDGSGSTDSDGTIAGYVWEESSTQIATGVAPTVTLDVGSHTITLTVTDNDSATDDDTVSITVNAAPSGGVTLSIEDFDNQTLDGGFTYDDDSTEPSWDFMNYHAFVEYETGNYGLRNTAGTWYHDLEIGAINTYSDSARKTLPEGTTHFQFKVYNNDGTYTKGAQSNMLIQMWWHGPGDLSSGCRNATISYSVPALDPGESTIVSIEIDDFVDDGDVFGSEDYNRWGKVKFFDILNGAGSAAANVVYDEFAFTGGSTNTPPTADAGSDQNVNDNDASGAENVTLDGSGSSDSDGTISSYVWTEDSTQIATGSGPTVSFAVGVHSVELTVTDDDSDTDTDSVVITVVGNAAPSVNAGSDQTIEVPTLQVDLDATVTDDGLPTNPGTVDVTWSKVSGPGTVAFGSSTSVDTTASFDTIGTYVLRLTADDDDLTASDEVTITVNADSTGQASNTAFKTFALGETATTTLTVEFTAMAVEDDIDGVTGVCYGAADWYSDMACILRFNNTGYLDARDGASYDADATLAYSAGQVFAVEMEINISTHTYSVYVTPAGGSQTTLASGYDFRSDQSGATVLDSWTITASDGSHIVSDVVATIPNAAPVADAGPDQSVTDTDDGGDEEVVLDGSGSYDTDGTIVDYVWENSVQIAAGVSPTVTLDVGSHTITLTVTDDDDATDTDTVVIIVNAAPNQPPVADAGPDQVVTDTDRGGDHSVTLDGSGSSDSDGTIVAYVWTENSTQIATGSGPAVTLSVGTHTITLTVHDDDDATDDDTVAITVNDPPTADAGDDQTVTDTDQGGDEDVTLDGSGSSDSDGSITSYVWEEDSTQIATGSGPTVTLDVDTHTITLTVTDDDSATDSDTVVITVEEGTSVSLSIEDFDNQTLDGGFTYDNDTTEPSWSWNGGHAFVEYETGNYGIRNTAGTWYHDLEIGTISTWSDSSRKTLPDGTTTFQFTVYNNDSTNTKSAQSNLTIQMWWHGPGDLSYGCRDATTTYSIPSLDPGESTVVSIEIDDFVDDGDVFGSEDYNRWGKVKLFDLLSGAGSAAANVVFDDFEFTD